MRPDFPQAGGEGIASQPSPQRLLLVGEGKSDWGVCPPLPAGEGRGEGRSMRPNLLSTLRRELAAAGDPGRAIGAQQSG